MESGFHPPVRALKLVEPPPPALPRCLNCDEELGGKFCQGCGQAAKVKRFTFHDFWHEVLHATLHFEHALPHTVKGILLRPGETIRAYLDGKRARTYSPVALLVLFGGLLAFANATLHVRVIATDDQQLFTRIYEVAAHYRAYLVLLVVPLDAIVPWLVLRRATGRGYTEQIAAATLIASGVAMIGLGFVPFQWLAKGTRWLKAVETASELAVLTYVVWSYASLQTSAEGTSLRRWMRGLASAFGTYVLYVLCFVLLSISVFASIAISAWVLHKLGFDMKASLRHTGALFSGTGEGLMRSAH